MKRTCDLHSTPQDAHGRTARNSWRCQQRLPHDPGSWQQLVRRGPASAPSGHARAGCRGSLVASLKPAELAKLKPPSTCPIHKILTTQVFEVCKIRRMDRTSRNNHLQSKLRMVTESALATATWGCPAATAAWGFGCPTAAPATTAHGAVREVYTIVEAKGEDILSTLSMTTLGQLGTMF